MLSLVRGIEDSKDAASFEVFWGIYPKRIAKKDARRAWDRLSALQRQQAIAGARKWARAWQMERRDSQFIPYPATWLHGERWEDELPTDRGQGSEF